MLIADRNLYLTADRSRVVEQNDTDQRSLLVGKGSELEPSAAEQYGIEVEDGRLVVKGRDPAEDKQVEKSEDDKQADAPENKRKSGWTPERRAAQAERMRRMNAERRSK